MSAPYDLLKLWLETLNVSANVDFTPADSFRTAIGVQYDVRSHVDETDMYRSQLAVRMVPEEGGEAPLHSVEAVVLAAVSLSEELSEEQSQSALHMSLPMVLYSTLRGHVASATGCMPHGPYLLPVIGANDLMEQIHGEPDEQEPQLELPDGETTPDGPTDSE